MQALIAKIFKVPTQFILRLTLYEMMCSSPDFENVRVALNDRTDWSIELVSTRDSVVYRVSHHRRHHSIVSQLLSVCRNCSPCISILKTHCSIHVTNGNNFFMLCTLSFLVVAETIQVQHGRLSPAELKVPEYSLSQQHHL